MRKDDWPLLKPEVQEWHLIVYTSDGARYRATVIASTREDAGREIVHMQMSEGRVVQRIELAD